MCIKPQTRIRSQTGRPNELKSRMQTKSKIPFACWLVIITYVYACFAHTSYWILAVIYTVASFPLLPLCFFFVLLLARPFKFHFSKFRKIIETELNKADKDTRCIDAWSSCCVCIIKFFFLSACTLYIVHHIKLQKYS